MAFFFSVSEPVPTYYVLWGAGSDIDVKVFKELNLENKWQCQKVPGFFSPSVENTVQAEGDTVLKVYLTRWIFIDGLKNMYMCPFYVSALMVFNTFSKLSLAVFRIGSFMLIYGSADLES
jgi:hypothetical protein